MGAVSWQVVGNGQQALKSTSARTVLDVGFVFSFIFDHCRKLVRILAPGCRYTRSLDFKLDIPFPQWKYLGKIRNFFLKLCFFKDKASRS